MKCIVFFSVKNWFDIIIHVFQTVNNNIRIDNKCKLKYMTPANMNEHIITHIRTFVSISILFNMPYNICNPLYTHELSNMNHNHHHHHLKIKCTTGMPHVHDLSRTKRLNNHKEEAHNWAHFDGNKSTDPPFHTLLDSFCLTAAHSHTILIFNTQFATNTTVRTKSHLLSRFPSIQLLLTRLNIVSLPIVAPRTPNIHRDRPANHSSIHVPFRPIQPILPAHTHTIRQQQIPNHPSS